MSVYGQGNQLQWDHGLRFVVILHFLTKGIRSRGFNSDDVFAELKAGGCKPDPSAGGIDSIS